VPIHDRTGAIIASLSMSAPVGDSSPDGVIKLLPQVQAARSRIESAFR
jgi:DNA-binding IclR family transcriptional regulator